VGIGGPVRKGKIIHAAGNWMIECGEKNRGLQVNGPIGREDINMTLNGQILTSPLVFTAGLFANANEIRLGAAILNTTEK
jgi:hypothetical protein